MLALLLFTGSAEAATELKAPVKSLMKGHKHVAVVKALSKAEDSRVQFQIQQQFYGEAEAELALRLDPAVYDEVEVGKTYVAGFSNIRRNYRFRELREVDPGGYRVVMILAGGPALLDDSAHVRLLFEAPKADPKPAPEELLQAALAAAGSDDARTRSFAILELSLRPEWLALMDADDAKLIQGYLASGELAPDSKNVLFELAAKLPAKLRDPWLAEEARHTLDALQPEFDLTTFVPRLAKTVLGILEEQGGEADSARVAPFLAANNPGVVEAALEALDRVDAKLARERAKAVLEQRDLHAESRRLLSEYLG